MSFAKRIVGFLAFCAFALVVWDGPRPLHAGPANCQWCEWIFDINQHKFNGQQCDSGLLFCMHCSALNSCHTAPQTGPCQNMGPGTAGHYNCYHDQQALIEADKLLESDDLHLLDEVVEKFASTLALTPEGYLLVLDCKGTVVKATRLLA
jgi:hypothetical protein